MGGGDLNMKKSWHPVLLVNQERVWKAEKAANEDKKAIAQLKKEREEERQLAELQRLQEERTGKKRVDKLDWMYAAPSNEGNALGGARISETMMEDYLLGKRRVDEVLASADKNVGNTHKEFIAVQNANTARDTASKIREDPLLAIKKQEEAALRAMANRPDVRKALRAMKNEGGESKEERKARKRAEKDDRKRERHERREKRRDYSRSPKSEYSGERDSRRSYSGRERSDYGRDRDEFGREERRRYRSRSRSTSPKREREDSRRRDDSPRRHRDERSDSRREYHDDRRRSDRREDDRYRDERRAERDRDDRVPPPRHYPSHNGHSTGFQNGHDTRDVKPHHARPGAMDMADRPTTARPPAPAPPPAAAGGSSLDEMRAARLAAMSSSAKDMDDQRSQALKIRAEREKLEEERDMAMRARMGKEAVNAGFFNSQKNLSLGEAMSRRGGQGLQRAI